MIVVTAVWSTDRSWRKDIARGGDTDREYRGRTRRRKVKS